MHENTPPQENGAQQGQQEPLLQVIASRYLHYNTQ